MIALAQFPSEILAIITSSLNGFHIGHLWLSGNRILNARLESGGVTHLKLALTQEFNCCWPILISRFTRLESLSIGPKNSNHRIWFRDVDLYGIPRNLKHLELEFDNLESSLFGVPFVVSDPYPDPIWSPPTDGEMTVCPFPLSIHLHRLETLQFRGEMHFSSILIPMLPPSLLSLHLPYNSIKSDDFNRLPSGLTRLELPNVRNSEISGIPLIFPSGLLHLDLHSLSLLKMDPVPCLPASLTYLNTFTSVKSGKNSVSLQLPSSLVTLVEGARISRIGYDFALLPPNLLHLKAPKSILRKNLETLPVGLQTLVVATIKVLSSEVWPQLPSTMTHLDLPGAEIPSECLLTLPSLLRVLKIESHFSDGGTPYPFMSTLEELSVGLLDSSVLNYAPKLRFLKLDLFADHSPPSLQHVTSLTSLKISMNHPTKRTLYPDSLTSLELNRCSSPNDFATLPRGLKSLHIWSLIDISGPLVAHLPPGLTELTANSSNSSHSLSDASAALLPSCLESLSIQNIENLTDIGIQNLPRTMKRLEAGNAPKLTNASASHFPRQLTSLNLQMAEQLSNECIAHLPRTLTYLGILQSRLTEECYASLPPRLSRFDIFDFSISWQPSVTKTKSYLQSIANKPTN